MGKRYFTWEAQEKVSYNIVEIYDGQETIVDQGYGKLAEAQAFLERCKTESPELVFELREIVEIVDVEVEDVPPWAEDPQDFD